MKWKIVPTSPTDEMIVAAGSGEGGGAAAYEAAVVMAPPYVVTDEDVEAAHRAYTDRYFDSSVDVIVHDCMRSALEAFLKRLGGES